MKYWDAYQSKWGFSDGDVIPPDAKACRTVYVREINKLAIHKKSKVRLLAWDRSGVHNCYLICVIPVEWVKNVKPTRLCIGQWDGGWKPKKDTWDEVGKDTGMNDAIQEAFDMNLDDLVEISVTIKGE